MIKLLRFWSLHLKVHLYLITWLLMLLPASQPLTARSNGFTVECEYLATETSSDYQLLTGKLKKMNEDFLLIQSAEEDYIIDRESVKYLSIEFEPETPALLCCYSVTDSCYQEVTCLRLTQEDLTFLDRSAKAWKRFSFDQVHDLDRPHFQTEVSPTLGIKAICMKNIVF